MIAFVEEPVSVFEAAKLFSHNVRKSWSKESCSDLVKRLFKHSPSKQVGVEKTGKIVRLVIISSIRAGGKRA